MFRARQLPALTRRSVPPLLMFGVSSLLPHVSWPGRTDWESVRRQGDATALPGTRKLVWANTSRAKSDLAILLAHQRELFDNANLYSAALRSKLRACDVNEHGSQPPKWMTLYTVSCRLLAAVPSQVPDHMEPPMLSLAAHEPTWMITARMTFE